MNLSDNQDLNPCNFDAFGTLYCIGENVTNDALKKISAKLTQLTKSTPIRKIHIKNTLATEIEANTFVNTSLDELFITYNSKLTSIDPKAFVQKEGFENFNNLIITNNNKLIGPNLFELSNNLKPHIQLVLSGNAIKEVPEHALKPTNANHALQYILLDNNHIERIGGGAFSTLNQIKVINISHNKIDTIGGNAFYMIDHNSDVVLDLSNNKITSESFNPSSFIVPWPHGFKPLDFSNNNITTLPQSTWGPLSTDKKHNNVYLGGNNIICDCNIKWWIGGCCALFNMSCANICT